MESTQTHVLTLNQISLANDICDPDSGMSVEGNAKEMNYLAQEIKAEL